jgi:nitrogen fixation protein FixH
MNIKTQSRNPWPIAIVAFFAVFATFLAVFVIWAVGQKQDLVAENYYEQEIRYQQRLDKINRTQVVAAQTAVTFDAAKNCVIVALPAAQAREASGRIHFYRPSNARLDHEMSLALNAAGVQSLDARSLASGLWKVRVEWTAQGADYFLDQSLVIN